MTWKVSRVDVPQRLVTRTDTFVPLRSAEQRLRNARQRLADALNAARNQMQVYIRQIPRAARVLRVSEFVDEYGAEVQAVISQTATRATREVRGADADAYDAAKAAVAGKKRKDEGEERGEKAKSGE